MSLKIHSDSVFEPLADNAFNTITTRAFFRRLTVPERKLLRNSMADAVADLREDLQRGVSVRLGDVLRQQLIDTGLLDQDRIDELLVDGTAEEAEL